MSEDQKPQSQSDFFSDLMFGRPPQAAEQEQQENIDDESEQQPFSNTSQENKQPDQLESIFALVQSLAPVIDKLGPIAAAISSYMKQNKKDTDDKKNNLSNNKNAND
ncbi:hypothetical protein [Halalkalibacter krulwichiae]|uniref:YqfQ-like protein n=1 Tax=Halalkalibacter krulwichiae TaxID=199441 RepID=A0A1X9MH85_9BACI|nr:hypothetical protein [Halalkalibacter krulwichiae]ARK31493.1 hypothetical protein BkAM31D_17520 [Halalkalibacter krulwichiae]